MKKNILIITALFFVKINYAQNNTWNTLLDDIKVRYIYSPKYKGYISKPKFGDKLLALDGKVITLRGFFLPTDLTGKVFILSYNPSNMCFFCNGAGIESIIELYPKEDEIRLFKRLETDDYFEVKGRLRLNADDFDHLIYILDEADFIKEIR